MMKKTILALTAIAVFSVAEAKADAGTLRNCISRTTNDEQAAACYTKENSRLLKLIQEEYGKIARNSFFKKFNDEQGGNRVQKIYNNWQNYCLEYCSLQAISSHFFTYNYNYQLCLYNIYTSKYEDISSILVNSRTIEE